jgi:hypothetical protein
MPCVIKNDSVGRFPFFAGGNRNWRETRRSGVQLDQAGTIKREEPICGTNVAMIPASAGMNMEIRGR